MILILGLIVWRLSHMIVKETGPAAIFARLRAHLASKQKGIGGPFDLVLCVACASVYIGAVAALWPAGGVVEWIAYTLAFSAVATFLEAIYAKITRT